MSNAKFSRREAAIVATAGLVALAASPARAVPQPHMTAALAALNRALAELNEALADKGGYRLRAIGHVKQAIADVTAGIQWANKR